MINQLFFIITFLLFIQHSIALQNIFQRESAQKGNIRYDSNSGVAVSLRNLNYETWGKSVEERAYNFLKNYSNLLTIAEGKDEESFKIISTKKVRVWTIVRFMQMYKGVPVYDSSLAITINENDQVRMVTSSYSKGIFFEGDPTEPMQTKYNIFNEVKKKYGKEMNGNVVIYKSETVIYHVEDEDCRLAWNLHLSINFNDFSIDKEIIYDDKTGEILLEVDKILDKNGNRYKSQLDRNIVDDIKPETSSQSMVEVKKSNNLRGDITKDERELNTNKSNIGVDFFKTLTSIFNPYRCEQEETSQSSQPSQPSISSSNAPSSMPSTLSPSTSVRPSSFPSEAPTRPPFNENITAGYVFDPDPLTTANKKCDPEFSDNEDANTSKLSEQLILIELLNITNIDGTYYLKGPYAEIVDFYGRHGLYEQQSTDFRFNRSNPAFEAVNCYYHVDKFMRYVNEVLGIYVMPIQYEGGVRCDPHANRTDNSYYNSATGGLYFGDGNVDDAEDSSVIIHELGHGIHDWITDGQLSRKEGLSEVIEILHFLLNVS